MPAGSARAKASQEAAAAKLQRQIEAENRALAASEAAQNAAAAATGGLTAAQLKAIDAYAAATRAGNDNAAAVGRQGEVFKAAGKTIAEHPVLVLAASVAAARALSGLATSAAGSLGAAAASTAAFAEGAAGMGPAVVAGATVAARGLAGLSTGATAAASGLGIYAEKVAGFTTATSLLSRGLSLIPPLFVPILAAFVAFEVGSAVFGKAYSDLQRLIDLGQKAQQLDIGAVFLKSFESVGSKIQATADQMDAALAKAGNFLKDTFGQANNLTKLFGEINATGVAGASGLKATTQADLAGNTQERIQAAIAGMKELDELGLHLASLKVGDAVFGPEFMERLRTGQTTIAQFAADLEAASRQQVLDQGQVERAVALNAVGIGVIALGVGVIVVQALSGRNAVITATNVRIEGQGPPHPVMHVPYKGRYRYVYDFERHEACAGEVVTVFESADPVSPAVVTVRRPTVLDEVRAYPNVAPDNPLPDSVRAGLWHVSVSIVSHCANREWTDPVAEFDMEVSGS